MEERVGSNEKSDERDEVPKMRNKSIACTSEVNRTRRKSLNTLHFDALQSAVSKLSRIDDFDLEELGYGFFSDVFKVTHKQTGKIMVLKRNRTTNTKLNILKEVQLMNRLSHPNILKFMGVCVHEGQLHALTEFLNGGDIDQLVQKKVFLSWLVRVRLAYDVSKGLKYLHSKGIFHRDLTAKNCLVRVTTTTKQKKKYSAVLADLGLAEKIPTKEEDKMKLRTVGTPYCMAPELLNQKPYDETSDFFSFGIVISQLILRTPSHPDELPRSNDFGLNRQLFDTLVKQGAGAPEIISGDGPCSMPPAAFLGLAYDCCEIDPALRPNIDEIVKRLEDCIVDVKKYKRSSKAQARAKMQGNAEIVAVHTSSITDLVEPPLSHTVSECISEEKKPDKNHCEAVHKRQLATSGGRHARLSRSSSDVSKELISQAASMIASSQFTNRDNTTHDDINDIVKSLREAFINPFSNLEDESLMEQKLTDLPSLDVLEMAFDLPSPMQSGSKALKRSHGSPVQLRKTLHKKANRPKSLLLGEDAAEFQHIPCSPTDHDSSTDSDTFLGGPVTPPFSDVGGNMSPVTKERHPSDTPEVKLKHAVIRSVIFSPQGTKLMSKWGRHSSRTSWKSISSLLSIISTKVGSLKKSISEPDLHSLSNSALMKLPRRHSVLTGDSSRSSSSSSELPKPPTVKLPSTRLDPSSYPAYITLPRKKRSSRRCTPTDAVRKRRARNSDDSVQDPTLLETLSEETSEATNKTSDSHLNATNSGTTSHQLQTKGTNFEFESPLKQGVQISSERENAQILQIQKPHSTQTLDDSSASNSSSNSSVGLQMTLKTGAISCSRRGRIKSPCNETSKSSQDTDRSIHSKHPGRPNRDSGYNDEAFFVCESPHNLSPTSTVNCPDSL